MPSSQTTTTHDINKNKLICSCVRNWPPRTANRRGGLAVDVCLFGFLTTFLVVGVIVILAPESDFANAVLRLAGVAGTETAATAAEQPAKTAVPRAVATPIEPTPSAPDAPSEPRPAESDGPTRPREVRRPAPPPAREEVRQPRKPDYANERSEIERFAIDADDRIAAIGRDYYLEMQAIGWTSILEPWHIDEDEKLRESKAIVRQASSLVSKYEARSNTLVRELRAEIYRLAISDWSKRKLEAILERYVIDARWDELWKLEKREIATMGKFIDLLAASKRGVAWKVENNQLLFAPSSSVLTKRNALIAELNRITEKKWQIRREVNTVRTKRLKEAKRRAEGG